MTTRRSFLGSILSAATPPGFVRAGVLMPVAPVIVMSHAEKVAALDALAGAIERIEQPEGLGMRIYLLGDPSDDKQWVRLKGGAWVSEATLLMLAKEFAATRSAP